MCGILGYIDYSKNSLSVQETSLVKESLLKLTHRGPNNTGFLQIKNCALGHTRLSILDLSANANQPFKDASGRYSLVYNGEIFNFKELKEKYIKVDYQFVSSSDTEILLYCLINIGEKIIEELNGFFAFVFYDGLTKKFIAARDQFGIKPFFYYYHNEKFAFASELRPLAYLFKNKLTLSSQAIFYYFSLSYIPHPFSLFEEIQKLPPGHYLKIDKNNFEVKKYFSIPSTSFSPGNSNSKNMIRELIYHSIDKRLNADVATGAFLSGGLDSSIVVAVASQLKKDLKTFSVGFKNNLFDDETKYSRLVANKFKTNHHEFLLDDNSILESIEQVLNSIDEPLADTSAIPTFFLSKSVKEHGTVFLSGDGADELFAGYNKYSALNFSINSPFLANFMAKFLNVIPAAASSREKYISNLQRQKEKFIKLQKENDFGKYLSLCQFTDDQQVSRIMANKNIILNKTLLIKKLGLKEQLRKDFNTVLENDFNLVLANDMLAKVDIMSMANSIEVRPIYLDLKLVNYVFGLPASEKIDYSHRKKILVDCFKGDLPSRVIKRPKKGFTISIGRYLDYNLKGQIENLFNKEKIKAQKIFDFENIQKVFSMKYETTDSQQLKWSLVVLQSWLDNNFFI